MKMYLVVFFLFSAVLTIAQTQPEKAKEYKQRVLETTEVDFLTSYYSQEGNNAAVTGGLGNEELTDVTGTVVIAIPLNSDDVLTIDSGISAYTSASSSNVNPFDGKNAADPFLASSGASKSDFWANFTGIYSHSSEDRNEIVSAKLSISNEYDYFSFGFGGTYTKLYNEKNTEFSINSNIFLDSWRVIYPSELRPFREEGNGLSNFLFTGNTITGNANYNPIVTELEKTNRNSYSLGFGFSQIMSKNIQGSLALDFIQQTGLLSTPFQRVYFADIVDSYIQDFHLAESIEKLPDSRFKVALGGRLHYHINETVVFRSFYRLYTDDWGIIAYTASIEVPIKVSDAFTIYPTYRFYSQSASSYFGFYNQNLSTDLYYTSDYDLSKYSANQYGIGITYTDIFTQFKIRNLGLKSIFLRYNNYTRNTGLQASIFSAGCTFVLD